MQIGNVVDGIIVDASNQIDIENVAIEEFTGTAGRPARMSFC